MLTIGLVTFASLAWLAVMFAAASYAERRPALWSRHWRYVYALSLGVHCTSWTFFGTVTQAARYGWPLPPTFLGAILLYALGIGVMLRLIRLARDTNASSIADLIATRLGKDAWLAATVTLVVALGLIPYVALQLKAVAMSFAILSAGRQGVAPPWQDSALYVAIVLAVFTILFGARRARATEHNRGLVFAMALESVFKLGAMLAMGAFVWFGLDGAAPAAVAALPPSAPPPGGFAPLMLLGALAMFVLPHQFHVAVVECRDERHVQTARWLFPLYLLLIALPVLPLARASTRILGTSVPSDLYVLALPLSQGHEGLALFAFLGGLSAATGMVVVSTLSLSLMIGNHWFAPGLLRGAWGRRDSGDLSRSVLTLRRAVIVAVMLLAWAYSRVIAGSAALADVGAISFSALATIAPALGFAVWRPQTPARAAVAGIASGFIVWAWVLLPPLFAGLDPARHGWLVSGPFGLDWLSPDGFFGLTGWSRLGRAVAASLFVGTATTLLFSTSPGGAPRRAYRGLDSATLRAASLRFLTRERVGELLQGLAAGPVPVETEARVERELAGVLGAASARVLLDAARNESRDLETVATIVSEASADLRFNQRVLEAALQNMSQGISVVDAQLRLVAWNRRYAELFDFPTELLKVGTPVADLARWALARVGFRGDVAHALERRIAFMRAGTLHLSERVLADGSIVEVRGNPMPGGGFVATFTDVTAFRRAQAGLMQANETLEQRVVERTLDLQVATGEAERANHAKSRFLAAIGHDLMQPLHAAQLFTDALGADLATPAQRAIATQIAGALDSTADLLTGLLDMSRLEAGGLVPQPRTFAVSDMLDPLASEFRAIAMSRGLAFRYRPTRAWAHGDAHLLRRVLQNFLANAVRYTESGSILLGVRHTALGLRIEVHDTGPGIEPAQQAAIFEEFRRGPDAPGQGLGLGLFIAERIAGLLHVPIALRSAVGRGTVFSVCIDSSVEPALQRAVPALAGAAALSQLQVLVLDNEAQGLEAACAVLERWGCRVSRARDRDEAADACLRCPDAVWLFDYHLDDGDTGLAVAHWLGQRFGPRPTVIMSADAGSEVRAAVEAASMLMLTKPLKPLALKSTLDRLLVADESRLPASAG